METQSLPADLNLTVAIPWSDHANATPIRDMQSMLLNLESRYGYSANAVELVMSDVDHLRATKEVRVAVGRTDEEPASMQQIISLLTSALGIGLVTDPNGEAGVIWLSDAGRIDGKLARIRIS